MAYKSLAHFISVLESAGELIRVREFVSPRLEVSEIVDRIVKNKGKALLFENNGTEFPILINAYGTETRMNMALGVNNLNEIGKNINDLLQVLLVPKNSFISKLKFLPVLKEISSFMPKRVNKRGVCQEVIFPVPDLGKLPILTCWPEDGGPFITLPVVHTKEPATGTTNRGMYRMQVFGPDSTGLHWHLHKGAAQHLRKYKELGMKMPVSVTLGGDPVYAYVASAPLPENMDEYLLAGFLRRKNVELVKCITNELEVPGDVDFVIEGFVDPNEELVLEGPFGDHTGFYSLADLYPKFHVTCITHRKNAIYPATIVGIPPMEDEWLGKATERIFLVPLKTTVVPELVDMNMPVEGVFHNILLTSITKTFPGQGMKVMNSLWGAGQMMFNKILVVVGENVNVQDCNEVARVASDNVDPLRDIQFIDGPVDVLDHSSRKFAQGSKIGIDATEKQVDESISVVSEKADHFLDKSALQKKFPEIVAINDHLFSQEISIVILALRKSRIDHIREICQEALQHGYIRGVKFIVIMDSEVDIFHIGTVAWICSNNIDPTRDCFFVSDEKKEPFPYLVIDGTRKSKKTDHFQRDWPNIIVMDDVTIAKVDENWTKYQVGPFISSPSIKYKSLVFNNGPIMDQREK
jgi:4-hydroxy-3-polyprenylbenzoate decarboxylase